MSVPKLVFYGVDEPENEPVFRHVEQIELTYLQWERVRDRAIVLLEDGNIARTINDRLTLCRMHGIKPGDAVKMEIPHDLAPKVTELL